MFGTKSNNEMLEVVMEIQKNQTEMMNLLHSLKKDVSLILKREKRNKNESETSVSDLESLEISSGEESTLSEENNESMQMYHKLRLNPDQLITRMNNENNWSSTCPHQSIIMKNDNSWSSACMRSNVDLNLKCYSESDYLSKTFQRFALMSVEDTESIVNRIQSIGNSSISPFIVSKAKICDRYPQVPVKELLNDETLSSFCLPLGLTVRIVPKCALDRAKELGWMGRKADKYAVHSFQDTAGNRTYGISISVKEEVDVGHKISIDCLKYKRKDHILAKKVLRAWRKYRARRSGRWGNMLSGISLDHEKHPKKMKGSARKLASLSYKKMVENSKLGDALIVERCYVLLGTQPQYHSLLFSSLQKLIEYEQMRQEDEILPTRQEIRLQRVSILDRISGMLLTPEEASLSYPKSELEHIRRKMKTHAIKLSSHPSMQFTLTLPMPQISEWGVVKLILKIGLSDLLFLIELLLLERSVLVVGECSEEVTSISFALLSLLKPYKWKSSFVPALADDMLDFVSSPVPFVKGVIARDSNHLQDIIADSRVQEAMGHGLSIVNLSFDTVCWSTETEVRRSLFLHCKSARDCWFIDNKLDNYQERFDVLGRNKSSSFHSFREYFQNGLSCRESVVLSSLKLSIREYLANFSGVLAKCKDGFRLYGAKDNISGERYFSAPRFSKPASHMMKFQMQFSKTQILASFYDERKNKYYENIIDKNRRYGVLLAHWIYFHWYLHNKKKRESGRNFATSCMIARLIKRGSIGHQGNSMRLNGDHHIID